MVGSTLSSAYKPHEARKQSQLNVPNSGFGELLKSAWDPLIRFDGHDLPGLGPPEEMLE